MEFGLDEEFPIYAGGLGILAGDFMKSADDLRCPVVGIGLLWDEGYTRQIIGADGEPDRRVPGRSRAGLPRGHRRPGPRPHRRARGPAARVAGRALRHRAALPARARRRARDRWITQRLYGGDRDARRAGDPPRRRRRPRARALGLDVDVYHFNEGHAVFAGLELLAERMAGGAEFRDAWADVREQHRVHHPHAGPRRQRGPRARRADAAGRRLRAGRRRAARRSAATRST